MVKHKRATHFYPLLVYHGRPSLDIIILITFDRQSAVSFGIKRAEGQDGVSNPDLDDIVEVLLVY